ncbi:MAG TPA: xanthine dehydrogenase accessory protein XdhC [Planctomycetota bacterium]|jgi:xanthine dehydrogenase accessory factor|nr:xanthine dehydrogenase accessory protein XdhC [Planctomycetota bacterium]
MDAPMSWLGELAALRAAGTPCVIVVVARVSGSAPREVGARMIVADGCLAWGTIGGGNLELKAIEAARELIERPGARSVSVEYPLGQATGQCCGGAVTLFFEPFAWRARRVVIFGAGHVAQALGALAGHLAAEVLLIDPRTPAEIQPTLPADPAFELLSVDAPEDEIADLPATAAVLVMTHSHALDQELVEHALRREEPFAYLGMIGSERKWQRFRSRLSRKGVSEEALDSVRCPIGLTRSSKEPGAIAISTAAELLEVLARSESPNA